MTKPKSLQAIQQIIFLMTLLLLFVARADASKLYEINLLKQDPNFQIDSRWFSNDVIKELEDKIKQETANKGAFQFEIASANAQQGKLLTALEQMALIDDDKLKHTPDFLEERAEIKSLLGFDGAAIEDINKIERKYQNWKTLWHRSLVLERAGQSDLAILDLRRAIAEAERFKFGDNYHRILLESAKQRHISALEPDPHKAEQIVSILRAFIGTSAAPTLAETIILLGLDQSRGEKGADGQTTYYPCSKDSPLRYATITPDVHQIRLFLNSAECMVTPDMTRKQFDAFTEKELWPDSMSGCGPGTLTLYRKNNKDSDPLVEFVFDGAAEPRLKMFFVAYKDQRTISKGD